MMADAKVSEYGMLSQSAFLDACSRLQAVSDECRSADFDSRLCGQGNDTYLCIEKLITIRDLRGQDLSYTEDIEDDDNASVLSARPSTPTITYDVRVEFSVTFSPTYRVPVLHFNMHNVPGENSQDITFPMYCLAKGRVIDFDSMHKGTIATDMGTISVKDHPVTDMPGFFVHPCRTAQAMEEVIGARDISSLQYLQIWFGLIGACVGLSLPIELAAKMQ